eukprot:jgi/Phyca11/512096/fgenesh2_kg.PHYCAscaffold_143_\
MARLALRLRLRAVLLLHQSLSRSQSSGVNVRELQGLHYRRQTFSSESWIYGGFYLHDILRNDVVDF